jgi:hypothetical protein
MCMSLRATAVAAAAGFCTASEQSWHGAIHADKWSRITYAVATHAGPDRAESRRHRSRAGQRRHGRARENFSLSVRSIGDTRSDNQTAAACGVGSCGVLSESRGREILVGASRWILLSAIDVALLFNIPQ